MKCGVCTDKTDKPAATIFGTIIPPSVGLAKSSDTLFPDAKWMDGPPTGGGLHQDATFPTPPLAGQSNNGMILAHACPLCAFKLMFDWSHYNMLD
jgi:hypothetical protein